MKKNANYCISTIALFYLAGTYIFLLNVINGASPTLLLINHFIIFLALLYVIAKRLTLFNNKIFFVFGILFLFIFSNIIVHSLFYWDLVIKREFINIFGNFILAYCIAQTIRLLNNNELNKLTSVYKIIIYIILTTFLYYHFKADKNMGFIIYPDSYHDIYQTLSAYLCRILLVGVLIFSLSINQRERKNWKYIFWVCILFGVLSLLSESKKETALFFLLAFFYYIYSVKIKIFDLIWICFLSFLLVTYFSDIIEIYFISMERSIYLRIDIFLKNFSYLFGIVGILGSPNVYIATGIDYPHNFFPSLLISHGLLGVLISCICIFYLIYRLFKKRLYELLTPLLAIFLLANIATHFDYMVLWFALGLVAPIAINQKNNNAVVK